MSKRTIIILITIVAVALLGWMYWYLFLKTTSSNTNTTQATGMSLKSFIPFGSSLMVDITTPSANTNETNNNQQKNTSTNVSNKFQKITNFAVAGAIFFQDTRPLPVVQTPIITTPTITAPLPTKTSTTKDKKTTKVVTSTPPPASLFEIVPAIRYVERSTGHVYQRYLDTNVEGEISNSTIPSINEVIFSSGAKNLIYRYLSDDGQTISSFLATLGGVKGNFLSENIYNLSVSPDGSKFFYISPFSTGVVGTVQAFGETKKSQIFSSPFTEWIPQWPTNQTIFLTTKASYSELGYIYSLNVSNNTFTKIFGDVQGLTTLVDPSGSMILYSFSTKMGPKLAIFNMKNQSNTYLNINGLAEKCVWTANSLSIYCGMPNSTKVSDPDSWYQGLDSFNDSIVKINPMTGSYITYDQPNENIDATHLFLDGQEQTLFFINKKDSTLWSLSFK